MLIIFTTNLQPAHGIGNNSFPYRHRPILRPANPLALRNLPTDVLTENNDISYNFKSNFTNKDIFKDIFLLMYLADGDISSNEYWLKKIKNLRGGANPVLNAIIFMTVVVALTYFNKLLSVPPGVGFVQPPAVRRANPHWGINNINNQRFNPKYGSSSLFLDRPAAMPHNEYLGLTKQERRNLPDHRDIKIVQNGRPELIVGYGQANWKVVDHGSIHGLPYTPGANSRSKTKTPRTEQNTLQMMDSIAEIANRENVIWFQNGMFQGGTERYVEAIHVFDPESKIISVFNRSTGRFITTCKLDVKEESILRKTGNFGGREDWVREEGFQQQNLENNFTPINRFESDVMGKNYVIPMNENSLPDRGVTRIRSFENDIKRITWIDNLPNGKL